MALLSSILPTGSPLQKYLQQNGRFPPVVLQVTPLDPTRLPIILKEFTEYTFNSSVLVPVDSFEFKMRNPTLKGSLLDFVRDGDIATLLANDIPICTGIIDSVNVLTSADGGEEVHINGRNLMAQLEDQSAVNDKALPIWGKNMSPEQVVNALVANTRINFYRLQQNPSFPVLPLFATEPGESKLSALMRYVEPLNMITWMDPDGTIVLGRPDMGSKSLGAFVMDRDNRVSNCLSIQANYASTRIPNIIIPVWTGQESVQALLPEQVIANGAQNPKRLLTQSHRVPKCIVVSNPQGSDPQALSSVNQFTQAGGSNVLAAYAKRELARANIGEVGVQVNLQGHYNSDLDPILIDSVYHVNYPRASLSEDMYVHTVSYSLSVGGGQRTSAFLCRLGCIVADISTTSQKLLSIKSGVSTASNLA